MVVTGHQAALDVGLVHAINKATICKHNNKE
ncbi:MAG: hypothetical protein GFH27_549287n286 [Chloroflexi bacterium AL-W]|nr:hypothetical protein [Chloroflexi bacterium AL-N1]NOK66560.1 hypothetical protein [Chloroflexi bacterium AL-N10]NOK71948.1 hypothetical protein [Chloroflexi bacterium AL-N5]NOK81205.1 hypothetical protein [Chloroflexi bacterium AL-W]NOK89478.1 hypothetical protein [Chloroflexi bacterium AL-N15]